MELGIIQVTSTINSDERYKALTDQVIPKCTEAAGGRYTIVSPPNDHLSEYVQSQGGTFIEYTGWEKDKSRKFREALPLRQEEWVGFLDDDILLDDLWLQEMQEFLFDREPGQYGFRLTRPDGTRHQFGEDWMQFPSPKYKLRHRGLDYNVETGYVEQSPTAYVANSVVHRDAYNFVQPFGIFGKSPDVNWCFALKEAGFAVGFNVKARAYHLGDRGDNR